MFSPLTFLFLAIAWVALSFFLIYREVRRIRDEARRELEEVARMEERLGMTD